MPHDELAGRLAEAYLLIGQLRARVEDLERRAERIRRTVASAVVGYPYKNNRGTSLRGGGNGGRASSPASPGRR